jgi:hypothetical protein
MSIPTQSDWKERNARFKVITAALVKNQVFQSMMLRRVVNSYRRFGTVFLDSLYAQYVSNKLHKTPVTIYQTSWRSGTWQGGRPQLHCCKILKPSKRLSKDSTAWYWQHRLQQMYTNECKFHTDRPVQGETKSCGGVSIDYLGCSEQRVTMELQKMRCGWNLVWTDWMFRFCMIHWMKRKPCSCTHHQGILGNGDSSPLIINLGTRWRLSGQPHTPAALSPGKLFALNWRFAWLHSRPGSCGQEKNIVAPPGLQLPNRPARSVIIIPPTLPLMMTDWQLKHTPLGFMWTRHIY